MGAETVWFVDVSKIVTETVEVQGVTEGDAREAALAIPGVAAVVRVKHWSLVKPPVWL